MHKYDYLSIFKIKPTNVPHCIYTYVYYKCSKYNSKYKCVDNDTRAPVCTQTHKSAEILVINAVQLALTKQIFNKWNTLFLTNTSRYTPLCVSRSILQLGGNDCYGDS